MMDVYATCSHVCSHSLSSIIERIVGTSLKTAYQNTFPCIIKIHMGLV